MIIVLKVEPANALCISKCPVLRHTRTQCGITFSGSRICRVVNCDERIITLQAIVSIIFTGVGLENQYFNIWCIFLSKFGTTAHATKIKALRSEISLV